MAKAGRKRKAGKRTASGRLSRAGQSVVFDQGTERTRMKFSVYGQDGSDAIGRAFYHGLLGDDGQNLKDTARKVFRAYWPMLAVGRVGSCLGDNHGAANDDDFLPPDERERKIEREKRLTEELRTVARLGHDYRRAFDALVIDINPDEGPAFLDAIIWAKTHGRAPAKADMDKLAKAIEALEAIAK